MLTEVLQTPFNNLETKNAEARKILTVEHMFRKAQQVASGYDSADGDEVEEAGDEVEDEDADESPKHNSISLLKAEKNNTIIDILLNPDYEREKKVEYMDQVLTETFPP